MTTEEKYGFSAMIDAAGGPLGDDLPAQEPDQPDMLDDQVKRGKPGRPAGSRNKATKKLVADLIEMGNKTPLEVLFDIFNDESNNVGKRIQAASAALPYCHQKLPVEIDTKGAPAVFVLGTIGGDDDLPAIDDDGSVRLTVPVERAEKNQANSDTYDIEAREVYRDDVTVND